VPHGKNQKHQERKTRPIEQYSPADKKRANIVQVVVTSQELKLITLGGDNS
jgi:hypothetical protein